MCNRSELVARHRSFLLIVLLSAVSTPAFPEPAGQVLFTSADVTAVDPAGNRRPLHKGAAIEEGDTLFTGSGRVQIQFKDGGFIALQPASQFKVERYRYTAAGDAEDGVVVSLIKGGLRTISGLVGKRDRRAYEMRTAVATIGIRGTEYALEADGALVGHVTHGAIEVCNGGGCLGVQSGQAFFVRTLTDLPALAERRAFLPPTAPRKQTLADGRSEQADEQSDPAAVAESSDSHERASEDDEAARDSGQTAAAQEDNAPVAEAQTSPDRDDAHGLAQLSARAVVDGSASGAGTAGTLLQPDPPSPAIDLGAGVLVPLERSAGTANVTPDRKEPAATDAAPAAPASRTAAVASNLPKQAHSDGLRAGRAGQGADGSVHWRRTRSTGDHPVRLQGLDHNGVGPARETGPKGDIPPDEGKKLADRLRIDFRLPGPVDSTPGHAPPGGTSEGILSGPAKERKPELTRALPASASSPGQGLGAKPDGVLKERPVEIRFEPARPGELGVRAFEFARRHRPGAVDLSRVRR
jgi:FecR protein